ncbi:MAG: hypothetical protein HFG31_05745 [Eubacterium sp.]|nr:hypothetical protein [Eubacterium sp.]
MEYIEKFFEYEIEKDENGESNWKNNKYLSAIKKAYDDTKRTFSKINSHADIDSFWKELIEEIKIKEVCENGNITSLDKFDEAHRKMCTKVLEMFREKRQYVSITYGQAQKIINMAFKYLYAYDSIKGKTKNIYKYCHMPLDKYTLAWYRRVKEKMKEKMREKEKEYYLVESNFAWSKKIDATKEGYENYLKIQNGIRLCLGEEVLKKEFEIWDREKQIDTLSVIIKSINNLKEIKTLKENVPALEQIKKNLETDNVNLCK